MRRSTLAEAVSIGTVLPSREHRFARIVHLAAPRARCEHMPQLGQRNAGAMLGDQAGFAEQPLTTALVALDVHRCTGIVGEGEGFALPLFQPQVAT
jgi:hypothetical protein